MTHTAYQPPECAPLALEAEYVVVGSGAGGASVAVGLARGGVSVAVVEAGPWRDPADYPSSVYGAMRDLFDAWGTTVTRGRALWPVVQARAVGGTTVINSAIVVRTPADIFALWKAEHGLDDPRLADDVWRYQDLIAGELSVEPVPEGSRGHSNLHAMRAAKALGMDGHVMDRNVKACLGAGQCLQGCREGRKQSTNLTYIPEVLSRGGSVVSCAPVDRVIFEGRRAVGVRGRFQHPQTRARGARFEVRARRAVIVAASATHSPALLERSGLQAPALGEGFRAHPGTGIFGVYPDRVDMNRGATQGWASMQLRETVGLKLETLSIPPELVASRLAGAGPDLTRRLAELPYLAMWVMAVRAESVGTVRSGLFGMPAVRYTMNRADMGRLRQGAHTLARMHFAAGARAVIPGILGLPYKLGPDEVDRLLEAPLDPRCWVAILSHLFGGCVMGTDPRRSVCDGRGQVRGYEGLFVADASILPTTLGVNPQHTIMALARRQADALLALRR